MKRAFFLIILLHCTENYAAAASAPAWPPTQKEIDEVNATLSPEELAQLQWQADQYQRSLRQTASTQDGQRHRGAWVAPVAEQTVVPTAPAKPPRQKHQTHKRQRSNSEPVDQTQMSPTNDSSEDTPPPPHYQVIRTETRDESLALALATLIKMKAKSQKLFEDAEKALKAVEPTHQDLMTTEINPELPKRTGFAKVLNLIDPEKKRKVRYLNQQTSQSTRRGEKAKFALNIFIGSILSADEVLQDLQNEVELAFEQTTEKQEQLRQRAHSTSGSPRLSMVKRT